MSGVRSEPLHTFNDHQWQTSSATFSSCTHYLATGGWDKCINVYNVEDVQHMFQLEGAHTMPITCVQWLDRHLLSTSADKTAVLWDSTTGLRKQTFEGHTGWVMDCCTSAEAGVVTASWDNNVGIWDPHHGTPVRMMSGHVAGVWSVAEMPRSQSVIASASEDCTMRLWDTRTGSSIATLAGGHNDSVLTCCWLDRDFLLTSGSSDCSILLWDTRTCKYLARVESHTDSVRELSAVSTTPGYLTSVGDQSIKVWDMREGEMRLCGSRTFSEDVESVTVSGLLHACCGVTGKVYLSMFLGLDEDKQDAVLERYKSAVAKLEDIKSSAQQYLPDIYSLSSSSPVSRNSQHLERSDMSDSGVETSISI